MPRQRDTAQISPTAHYTGQTWLVHGLSDPVLSTGAGRFLYDTLRPVNVASALLGGPTLDGMLTARHRTIDAYLRSAIDDGSVSQVVEIACGLSPRGLRFANEFAGQITYVEADLEDMAELKRQRLAAIGALNSHHRVVTVDALADEGPHTLDSIMATLDSGRGTAIITEGLVNYFDQTTAEGMFSRFARALQPFPHGLYLTDLHLAGDLTGLLPRVFAVALSVFVRGQVHLHYADATEAVAALRSAGFTTATVEFAADGGTSTSRDSDPAASLVRVVRATM